MAQPYLLALWLAGVCVLGLRLAGGLVGVWRVSQRRLPLPLTLAERVERLGKRLRIDALPRVFLSRHISEALAVGFWRPVVLVPAAWVTEMPLEVLEAVIAHELAHLRRLDLWVNLLQRVVETLFFYHPAVWWVSRQLREEREMCCDELAVGATGARLAYVEALELIARERLAGVRPALAAGIRGESNMKLLARLRNVLRGAGDESGSLWPAGLLALLLPLAMWGMTWGLFNPTPAAAVADDRDDDDDDDDDDRHAGDDDKVEKKRDREDGDEKEGAADKERGERKIRKEGDQPRKEGERRDGDEPKKGPRDGDQPRKEGERRDGDDPKKKAPRDGDAPKKPPREGEDVRKDPVKKEIRKDQPDGEAPRKKVVKEGDAPRKEDPKAARKKEGEGESKLEALVKELRSENDKLRAELRELRGEKVVKPGSEK
ncbi:MAG: M56 family metallopeptidase, partial [Pirellulaceae bacterium]